MVKLLIVTALISSSFAGKCIENQDSKKIMKSAFRLLELSQFEQSIKMFSKVNTPEAHFASGFIFNYALHDEKKAIDFFELAAKENISVAIHELSNIDCYDYLKKIELKNIASVCITNDKDAQSYKKYYELADILKDKKLYSSIGNLFNKGLIFKKNKKKALENYSRSVELGNSKAMTDLAFDFFKGKVLQKNEEKGFFWLHKSASRGSTEAMIYLGFLYENGIGVKQSTEFSKKWYEKAFYNFSKEMQSNKNTDNSKEVNNIDLQNSFLSYVEFVKSLKGNLMGTLLENRASEYEKQYDDSLKNSTEVDSDLYCKAFDLYKQAFDLYSTLSSKYNDSKSMLRIADLFKKEKIFDNKEKTALENSLFWYQKAYQSGNAKAAIIPAKMFQEGKNRNVYKCLNLYFDAIIRLGYCKALDDLSTFVENDKEAQECFENSLNIFIEDSKSKKLITNSGTFDERIACVYLRSKFLDNNQKKAFNWFKNGADMNDPICLSKLGYMYRKGQGIEKNFDEAKKYYLKAVDLGSDTTMLDLGFMYENGDGVAKDYKIAMDWYQKSLDKGNFLAAANLGNFYLKGIYVEKDIKKAYESYSIAAEGGDSLSAELADDIKRSGLLK